MKNLIIGLVIAILLGTTIFTSVRITNLNKEISDLKTEKETSDKLSEELKLQKKDCITLIRGAIDLADTIPTILFVDEKDQNAEFNKFITLRNNLENSCKKYVEPERTEPLPLLEEK
jgi:hypothetical protein